MLVVSTPAWILELVQVGIALQATNRLVYTVPLTPTTSRLLHVWESVVLFLFFDEA